LKYVDASSLNISPGLIAKLFLDDARNDDLIDEKFSRGYNSVYQTSSKEV